MLNPEVLKCHEDLITLETYMYNKEKQWIIRAETSRLFNLSVLGLYFASNLFYYV